MHHLPGVSLDFSKMVFNPKLYLGDFTTVDFSGLYEPGAKYIQITFTIMILKKCNIHAKAFHALEKSIRV